MIIPVNAYYIWLISLKPNLFPKFLLDNLFHKQKVKQSYIENIRKKITQELTTCSLIQLQCQNI